MSDEESMSNTPQEILKIAQEVTENLLPEKSKKLYNKSYDNFMQWRSIKKISSFSENVLLAYFQEIGAKFAPSTLWAEFSMVKSTLSIYHQTDISKYKKLHAFLKRKSEGYKTKKSKTFSPDHINSFLNEAPDEIYLLTKIAVIFGIMGACRRQELHSLLYDNVQNLNGTLLVNITNTKTKIDRSFTVTGRYFSITKKYIDLRPASCQNTKFFIKYCNGKCTSQNVGINTFGNMGKVVANFIKLPNPESYTGHCFRRTSATLLIDAGGDITALKRHGGWKSTSVAESYIDNSIQNKVKISKTILNSIEQSPSTSNSFCYTTNNSKETSTSRIPNPSQLDKSSNSTKQPKLIGVPSTSKYQASSSSSREPTLLVPSTSSNEHATSSDEEKKSQVVLDPSPTSAAAPTNEINLSQILKQQNAPLIITKNNIQNLHIHFHK